MYKSISDNSLVYLVFTRWLKMAKCRGTKGQDDVNKKRNNLVISDDNLDKAKVFDD